MDERLVKYEDKMKKTIENLESEFNAIRAGRANPHILDRIKVDYYGTESTLQMVGNITVPDPKTIQIAPWDKGMLKTIEKAIQNSDVGINPSNDGTVIRLVLPDLTEERRKDLSKEVKKKSEEAKVAIRNIRRDGVDAFKKIAKSGEVSEDTGKDLEDAIQKLTDKYIAQVDKQAEAKTAEIMKV